MPDSQQDNLLDWDRLPSDSVFVINGIVLNADSYLTSFRTPIPGDLLDKSIREAIRLAKKGSKDATRLFRNSRVSDRQVRCIRAKYKVCS